MTRPTFEEACRQFVHRYTMEHVPSWAHAQRSDGTFYAPQYQSDREWYEKTKFYGEPGHVGGKKECHSSGQSWPLGMRLGTRYDGQVLNPASLSAGALEVTKRRYGGRE